MTIGCNLSSWVAGLDKATDVLVSENSYRIKIVALLEQCKIAAEVFDKKYRELGTKEHEFELLYKQCPDGVLNWSPGVTFFCYYKDCNKVATEIHVRNEGCFGGWPRYSFCAKHYEEESSQLRGWYADIDKAAKAWQKFNFNLKIAADKVKAFREKGSTCGGK